MSVRRVSVGLDIGGTKTDAVAVEPSGGLAARARLATRRSPSGVLDTAEEALAVLRDQLGACEITAVGIGIPGQTDGGVVRHAVNLGIAELDLAGSLESLFGVAVAVENDVKAAALGAHAEHGAESLAYLNLGTGIAAGMVVAGRLWRGAGGTAGEIGHVSIDPAGPECPCGQRGCIEVFAGGAAVARRWRGTGALPVREVFDAADREDGHALVIRRDVARAIAAAVRIIVLSVDVERVVFGGGVSRLGERLREDVLRQLHAESASSGFLGSLALDERIVLQPAESPAPAVGAAIVGARAQEGIPVHG